MTFREFITEHSAPNKWLLEASDSRYAVDVNYRTRINEVLNSYAKIALAYVSAGLKQNGFHVKHVFEEEPLRILVSSRNWDDGEWVGVASFNPNHEGGCFVVSKGFYNKDRKTVSIQGESRKCSGDSPADVVKDMRILMHEVKGQTDRHIEKLRPIPLKRGPKRFG